MKTGYLCGGIMGLTDAEANGWREEMIAAIPEVNWLNPMRRDYRGRALDCAAEIVDYDLKDIDESDFLLVNAARPSWGTAMELFYAARAGKYVIVVYPDRSVEISPWVAHHSSLIVFGLEAAKSAVRCFVTGRMG